MRVRFGFVLLAVVVAATAGAALALGWLGGDDDRQAARTPATVTTTRTAARAPSVPALCRKLDEAVTGRVQDAALNELSGLVASRTRPGLLYSHEDSGAGPQVWALRADGSVAGGWTVPGAEALDWEDMATGPSPTGEGAVLYLGDIGDNAGARPFVDVYRVPEPAFGTGVTAPAERLRLRYPDGPRDAETLLVDPRRGTLVIVAKALTRCPCVQRAGLGVPRRGDAAPRPGGRRRPGDRRGRERRRPDRRGARVYRAGGVAAAHRRGADRHAAAGAVLAADRAVRRSG